MVVWALVYTRDDVSARGLFTISYNLSVIPIKPPLFLSSNHRPRYVLSSHHPPSKLANKENEHRSIPEGKAASDDLPAPKQQATPHETNV